MSFVFRKNLKNFRVFGVAGMKQSYELLNLVTVNEFRISNVLKNNYVFMPKKNLLFHFGQEMTIFSCQDIYLCQKT